MVESLFSFELYVYRVDDITVPCTALAVGFRFLDYPTVVVQYSYSTLSDNQDDATSSKSRKNGYHFARGKSCLFRNNLESLSELLSEVPLYVMLFDSSHQTSKLIGCCSIPLVNLVTQIRNEVNVSGINSPANAEEHGEYKIYNLMSSLTGKLKLLLKLNFYGASSSEYPTRNGNISPVNVFIDVKNKKVVDNAQVQEAVPSKTATPTENTEVKVCNEKQEKSLTKISKECGDKSVQCNISSKRKDRCAESREGTHGRFHGDVGDLINTRCPPPLFLNLHENKNSLHQHKQFDHEDRRARVLHKNYGSFESISSEVEPYIERLQPLEGRNNIFQISGNSIKERVRTKNGEATKGITLCKLNHDGELSSEISELPLLSALSTEIIKLGNLMEKLKGKGDKPKDIIEGKVENMENMESIEALHNEQDMKDNKYLCREIKSDKELKRAAISKLVQQTTKSISKSVDNKSCSLKKLKVSRENYASKISGNKNEKMKKRKLKCGTTRTQKLRYNLIKQSKKIIDNPKTKVVPGTRLNDNLFHSDHSDKESIHDIQSKVFNSNIYQSDIPNAHINQSNDDNTSANQSNDDHKHVSNDYINMNQSRYSGQELDTMTLDSLEVFIDKHGAVKKDLPTFEEIPESVSRSNEKQQLDRNPGFYSPNIVSPIHISDLGETSIQQRFPKGLTKKVLDEHLSGSEKYAYDSFPSEDSRSDYAGSRTSSISIQLSDSSNESFHHHSVSTLGGRASSSRNNTVKLQKYPMVSDSSKSSHRSSRVHFLQKAESGDESIVEAIEDGEHSSRRESFGSKGSSLKSSQSKDDSSERARSHSQLSSNAPIEISKEESSLTSDRSARNIRGYSNASHSKSSSGSQVISRNSWSATIPSSNVLPGGSVSCLSGETLDDNEASQKEHLGRSFSPLYSNDKIENRENDLSHPLSLSHSSKKLMRQSAPQVSRDDVKEVGEQYGEASVSQVSGETMKEIDKFLREYSPLSNGSSVLMPTDEFSQLSPDGSPLHKLQYSTTASYGFDKSNQSHDMYVPQLSTEAFTEVDVLPKKLSSPSSDSSVPASSDEKIDNKPKASAFSPHQSKHYFRKKRGDILREIPTLSGSSDHSSESSVDSGF